MNQKSSVVQMLRSVQQGLTSDTAFVKDTNTATVKNVYGIGVSHDLGGAKLQAGYVDNADGSVADFGIVFNF